ncbi:MAG TPA: serine/threonine-protein kinase [Bryobacteraceae bacterium]|nr:serine/threonine-protein kinase [Bryobacteraceae bacterium]
MARDAFRQRAEEIGDSALDFDSAFDRGAFIDRTCGDDMALRASVMEYVRGADTIPLDPVIRERPTMPLDNRQIGPWKLLRALGEGGFGVVYLAERNDGQVRQLGAMKFLKGTVHSRDLELRFLDERQILADLNHPWIVRLIDADVNQGQPYFVMEYVQDGLPIDVYCRQKALSVKDRLALFRKVCEAISYAHRKLVVHRDLKPANILIAPDGTPRLLDFGIAKILDPARRGNPLAAQSTRVLMGTERYFSPEQARRESVDTATDIYSLAVVLYELLTGTDPYDLARRNAEPMEQIVCTALPEPPSKALARDAEAPASKNRERVRRQLVGDLDTIVLMALRKEAQRRYASVDQFSEDLRRYLEGLPVAARADTYGYRARKFVKRHQAAVAAAALVFLSLGAGLFATTWEARRAQAARARAERRFNDVRKLASTYLFEFHDAIAKIPGTTAARALVVRRALEYLDSLSKEASSDRDLQLELATAYQKVGDAQGRPGFANLGDRTGALASYGHALAIRQALAKAGPADAALRRDLATNYDRIADTLLTTGQTANALDNYRQGYALREALLSADPNDRDIRRGFATSCQREAQALLQSGRVPEAKEKENRALAMFQSLAENRPGDAVAQRDLFIAYIKEGDLLAAGGDKAAGLQYYQRALPISQAVERIADDPTKARREVASVHDKIGNLLAANKDSAGSLENYRTALHLRESLAASDPKNAEVERDLSISHEKIGNILVRSGDAAGALAQYRHSLAIDSRLLDADPDNAQSRLDCAGDHEEVGGLLLRSGDLAGALASQNQARELREWVAHKDEKNADVRADLASNYKQLGDIDIALAKKNGGGGFVLAARAWYQRGLDTLGELQKWGALDEEGAAERKEIAAAIVNCDTLLKARSGQSR